MLEQFIKFGIVGGIGFLIDTATVYGVRASVGLYAAGLLAYLTAATATWFLNRLWTFHGLSSGSVVRQWAKFLSANLVGFILNRGAYFILIAAVPLAAAQPVIAVAAGSFAGMFFNFSLSRQLVFR